MYSWLITNDMRFIYYCWNITSSGTLFGWILPYLTRIQIPRYRIRYYFSPIFVSYVCLFLGFLYFMSHRFLSQDNVYGSKNIFKFGLSVVNIIQAFLSYILIFPASFKIKGIVFALL